MCGGGGVSGLMSSSSVTVGLCDLLTSRLPSRTIPGIWVILTWWGFWELFFFRERLLLEDGGTAEPDREDDEDKKKNISNNREKSDYYLCRSQSLSACSGFLQRPPLSSHPVPPEASSSSSAGFPPSRPPATRQPDTPPREPGLICCWMKQLACWRTEAATDPGGESWRCLSLGWRCGTPLVRRQMAPEPPWRFLGPSWGSGWLLC